MFGDHFDKKKTINSHNYLIEFLNRTAFKFKPALYLKSRMF